MAQLPQLSKNINSPLNVTLHLDELSFRMKLVQISSPEVFPEKV